MPLRTLRWIGALLIAFSISSSVLAQPYWAKVVSGIGNEHTADVQVDSDGSIYIIGEFGGTIQFGGQTYLSAGGLDVFIAKMTPEGDVTWFKQGGGNGIDRGIKLAIGTSALAITGEFMGNATFQGTTINSAGGTADIFVAVLDKSDGSLQWIKQGGGTAGTDSPNGISIAADGKVCVAGEFRGAAQWDASSLTSMNDPSTGQPSTDVFIACYSAAGDLLWLKQGTAKFADKAVAIAHDPAGNLFVTGQFSDTITFDQTHPNVLMNASFLLRLDGQGNEVWFRRFGGAGFNHVRDLVYGPNGRVLIVGDVQGTMVYSGTTDVFVGGTLPFAYYLLSVDPNGQLIAHNTMGSQSGVDSRAIMAAGNTIAVLGQFNCRFNAFSDHYGAQGIFMAVGTEDLFTAKHSLASLDLQEAQQYGGRSAKSAGGIGILPGGDLVFTGSFQQNLIFPSAPGFDADLSSMGGSLQGNGSTTYCGDQNYGWYAGCVSVGLRDGFVARGHVNGRQPYDWWIRPDPGCDRIPLEPCIRTGAELACPDTITSCGQVGLNVWKRFSHASGVNSNYLGPPLTFQWSTGSTNANITASTTGYYSVVMTSVNGCWQWTDSIYVVIHPLPPATFISDDVVVNTETSSPQTIHLCDPETHWVWATNASTATDSWWTLPFPLGTVVQSDSVQVDTTGLYVFTVVNEFGCMRHTSVDVIDDPAPELPDIEVDIVIDFTQDGDLNDSLWLCAGAAVEYIYTPSWTIDGVAGAPMPEGLTITWGLVPNEPTTDADEGPQDGTLPVDGPGWYVVEIVLQVSNKPCGTDSIRFYASDSIYVDLFPALSSDVELTGPSVVCDGDTALLVATCVQCDELVWSGPSFIQLSEDSILVIGPGLYSVTSSVNDPNGCAGSSNASINVTMPTGAVLSVSPASNIICPDAFATLTSSLDGTDQVWYGPQGPIYGQGNTLVTNIPGEYQLSMMVGGCPVTSNSVVLTNYGTPFLSVQPAPVLCYPGDAIELQATSVPGSVVEWLPPLSGSSLTQTITQPGTYSCTVTACGITTPLSVTVIESSVDAVVNTPGPFFLCEGDSLILEGVADDLDVQWLPGFETTADLLVTSAGEYLFSVQNDAGCRDTAAAIIVTSVAFQEPLIAFGDTICSNDIANLSATGSGTLVWYSDAAMTNVIGSGTSFSMAASVTTVIYVRQEDSGCMGLSTAVTIHVIPRPDGQYIEGTTSLCLGDPFELLVTPPDSVDIHWSTPTGTITGNSITISATALDDSGFYTITPSFQGCDGESSTHELIVHAPIDPGLPSILELCLGGSVIVSMPAGYSQIQWSNGSTEQALLFISAAQLSVTAIDQNGCPVYDEVVIHEEDCELIIPNVFSPNGDGINDIWLPDGGFTKAAAWIYNRWGNVVYEGDMVLRPWDGRNMITGEWCSDGVYYYVLELDRAVGSASRHNGYFHLNK